MIEMREKVETDNFLPSQTFSRALKRRSKVGQSRPAHVLNGLLRLCPPKNWTLLSLFSGYW